VRWKYKIPIVIFLVLIGLAVITVWAYVLPFQSGGYGCITNYDIVYNNGTKFDENEIRNAIKAGFPQSDDDWLKSPDIVEPDENGIGKIAFTAQFTEAGGISDTIINTLEKIDYISKVEKAGEQCWAN